MKDQKLLEMLNLIDNEIIEETEKTYMQKAGDSFYKHYYCRCLYMCHHLQ